MQQEVVQRYIARGRSAITTQFERTFLRTPGIGLALGGEGAAPDAPLAGEGLPLTQQAVPGDVPVPALHLLDAVDTRVGHAVVPRLGDAVVAGFAWVNTPTEAHFRFALRPDHRGALVLLLEAGELASMVALESEHAGRLIAAMGAVIRMPIPWRREA